MDAITITIERFDGAKRYGQEYKVDTNDIRNKTVLATLIHIKEKLDPTLNFTASCRSAICGACGVRVNGHAVLACDTKIEDLLAIYDADALLVSPLANYTVLSDLVVDWEPSIENLRVIHPELEAKSEFSREKGCTQSAAEFENIRLMWDCILCGCCASECNKFTANNKDYLEPFVFTHAWRAAADSRSRDPMTHGKPAADNGLWKCVHCQECANVCPKQIKSVDDIAGLRALTVKRGMNQGKGPKHARAFLADLQETGRLNEVKLALRTEGLSTFLRVGLACTLWKKGKMNPLEVLGDDPIQGHADLARMLDAAKAATQGKE
jgi:succinate dehydrogenase / fumarate reductase iron-sulfur subunit